MDTSFRGEMAIFPSKLSIRCHTPGTRSSEAFTKIDIVKGFDEEHATTPALSLGLNSG